MKKLLLILLLSGCSLFYPETIGDFQCVDKNIDTLKLQLCSAIGQKAGETDYRLVFAINGDIKKANNYTAQFVILDTTKTYLEIERITVPVDYPDIIWGRTKYSKSDLDNILWSGRIFRDE